MVKDYIGKFDAQGSHGDQRGHQDDPQLGGERGRAAGALATEGRRGTQRAGVRSTSCAGGRPAPRASRTTLAGRCRDPERDRAAASRPARPASAGSSRSTHHQPAGSLADSRSSLRRRAPRPAASRDRPSGGSHRPSRPAIHHAAVEHPPEVPLEVVVLPGSRARSPPEVEAQTKSSLQSTVARSGTRRQNTVSRRPAGARPTPRPGASGYVTWGGPQAMAVEPAVGGRDGVDRGLRDVVRAPLRQRGERSAARPSTSGSAAVSGTNRPRGGMPGSSSRMPTEGGRLKRRGPAPPGFITVTTMSTRVNSGRWVWPKTMISARGELRLHSLGRGRAELVAVGDHDGRTRPARRSRTCGSRCAEVRPSVLP